MPTLTTKKYRFPKWRWFSGETTMSPVDKLAYLQLQITQVYRGLDWQMICDRSSHSALAPVGQSINALKWEQSIQHVLTIYMSTWQTDRQRPKTMSLRVFFWRLTLRVCPGVPFDFTSFYSGFHFHLSAAFDTLL